MSSFFSQKHRFFSQISFLTDAKLISKVSSIKYHPVFISDRALFLQINKFVLNSILNLTQPTLHI